MGFNGKTINGEMNLQQSGGTGQSSLSCLFISIVMFCALRHEAAISRDAFVCSLQGSVQANTLP